MSADNKCRYSIYCVVSDDVIPLYQNELKKIVEKISPESSIIFKYAGDAFKKGFVWGYNSTATYYRFMLHELFPDLKKIIYSDVDVIFQNDLISFYDIDMEDNFIAAVKDNLNVQSVFSYHFKKYPMWQKYNFKTLLGNYVNIGVSLWNLDKIRTTQIYEEWNSLITEEFPFSDQDIVNYTCQGKIKHISPVFNAMAANYGRLYDQDEIWKSMKKEGLLTEQELKNVYEKPEVIHYIGPKPWNEKVSKFFEIWWFYASLTNFNSAFLVNYIENNKKCLDILEQNGFNIEVGYILFDPYSTVKELKESLDFFDKTRLYNKRVYLIDNLKITPFSKFYDMACSKQLPLSPLNVQTVSYDYKFADAKVQKIWNTASKWKRNVEKKYSIYEANTRGESNNIFFAEEAKILNYLEFQIISNLVKYADSGIKDYKDLSQKSMKIYENIIKHKKEDKRKQNVYMLSKNKEKVR